MYAWLNEALRESSHVVTANQRLARVLTAEFARQQLALGHSAWRTPAIRSWQNWLGDLLASAAFSRSMPTRINSHQSKVLWERCLRREVADPLLNMAMLVRQAREAWARMHEFAAPLSACAASAIGRDQHIFARAAGSYQSILANENWVDEAGVAGHVAQLIENACVELPKSVTFAGFDRLSPQVSAILDALREVGVVAAEAPRPAVAGKAIIHRYENPDAELRAAGAWARNKLQESPDQVIAIVATHLEQNAERCTRLLREGLAPGWQHAGPEHQATVNVSYGCRFSEYPAIAIALLALRWLQNDLSGRDVSLLLRTSTIGSHTSGGRSRLELSLRRVPDRNWSPSMLLGILHGCDDAPDARDLLSRVKTFGELRANLPRRAAPSAWVELIDDTLGKLNWPGDRSLDSQEFQLINRWRELLNDLARLQLVSSSMTLAEALQRLGTMAAETVFQPESDGAIVQLLGPLEAAGMQFDRLWISGLSAANWPPSGRPSALLSREIQRRYGMPDADPDDTLDYARRVLARLVASAVHVEGSCPLTDGDAEQTETGLLSDMSTQGEADTADPGWHATDLVSTTNPVFGAQDPVPPVSEDESISGGATTINYQLREPFSAFAFGRLGVRPLIGISSGLAASLRGSLIHDALSNLYSERPSQTEITSWDQASRQERIELSLQTAFARHERYADPVLGALLELERQRDAELLRQVITLDTARKPFRIAQVEAATDVLLDGIRLGLRIDRIDQLDDGELVILDYKTGMRKVFRRSDGIPNDMQLVVYAFAVSEPVAGLGLINVDSRSVDIDAAGTEFTPELDWSETLSQWKQAVLVAARDLRRGDVRINGLLDRQAARSLSLLSRIAELRREV